MAGTQLVLPLLYSSRYGDMFFQDSSFNDGGRTRIKDL
jgi:hypothetical protein